MGSLFKVEELTKQFPGVTVLNNVNIAFERGKIHAIVGENGAGKSTLMNIIYGVYQDYKGKLLWNEELVKFDSPIAAQNQGIAMVHQENSLVENLTVMDNIFLGRYPKKGIFVDREALTNRVNTLLKELKIENIAADTKVRFLSVAQKQLIEIVKALSYNAEFIMLDEPTAALTAKETEYLMNVLNDLKSKNVAIAYVSHRLEEVFDISDEISVLRDGEMVKHFQRDEFNKEDVIRAMIGRDIDIFQNPDINNTNKEEMPVTIKVEGLGREGKFHGVSFEAKRGEIVGFGGLVGAGRTELMEAIFGYNPATEGKIIIGGKERHINHPADAVKLKIGMVPEERKIKGVFGCLSVKHNINVVSYKDLRKSWIISKKLEDDSAKKYVDELSIKTTSINKRIEQLSGGNQQKCIVSRWLRIKPDILILDEPTHGIDIGAKEDIYQIITKLAKQGVTILLISSEMPELIRLSDKIVVMCEGKQTAILEKDEISQEKIMIKAMRN